MSHDAYYRLQSWLIENRGEYREECRSADPSPFRVKYAERLRKYARHWGWTDEEALADIDLQILQMVQADEQDEARENDPRNS